MAKQLETLKDILGSDGYSAKPISSENGNCPPGLYPDNSIRAHLRKALGSTFDDHRREARMYFLFDFIGHLSQESNPNHQNTQSSQETGTNLSNESMTSILALKALIERDDLSGIEQLIVTDAQSALSAFKKLRAKAVISRVKSLSPEAKIRLATIHQEVSALEPELTGAYFDLSKDALKSRARLLRDSSEDLAGANSVLYFLVPNFEGGKGVQQLRSLSGKLSRNLGALSLIRSAAASKHAEVSPVALN